MPNFYSHTISCLFSSVYAPLLTSYPQMFMFHFINEQKWNTQARINIKLIRLEASTEFASWPSLKPMPFISQGPSPTSDRCKQLLEQIETNAQRMIELETAEEKAHRLTWDRRSKLIRAVQKVHGDPCFEIERVIGTGDNASAGDGLDFDEPSVRGLMSKAGRK